MSGLTSRLRRVQRVIRRALGIAVGALGVVGILAMGSTSADGAVTGYVHLSDPTFYGHSGWVIAPVPAMPTLDLHVACTSSVSCVASDDTDGVAGSTNEATFFASTDGGVSWSAVGNFNDGVQSLSCVHGRACMAAPFAGDPQLIVSSDDGHDWSAIAEPPFGSAGLTPESVACTPVFCIVIGSGVNGHIPPHTTAALITTDLGHSWSPITLPPLMSSVQAMSCAPSGQCYLVYDTSTHKFSDMAATTNRGRTWHSVKRAPGYTSLGGFSCPSAESCVYLANQVLEVTTNGGHTWTSHLGPFSNRHINAISAFSLSCTAVNQCLIGGSGANRSSSQQLVWVEGGTPWKDKTLRAALTRTDLSEAQQVARDFAALNDANDATSSDKAVTDLLSDFESNCAALDTLALHATGREQIYVAAVGDAWASLDNALFATSQDIDGGRTISGDIAKLESGFRSLFTAESLAGDATAIRIGQTAT